MESRRYWGLRPDTECGEPRCAEGPAGPWSAVVGADTAVPGIGWALAIPINGILAGYYPPGTPPGTTPPPHPPVPHVLLRYHRTRHTCCTAV